MEKIDEQIQKFSLNNLDKNNNIEFNKNLYNSNRILLKFYRQNIANFNKNIFKRKKYTKSIFRFITNYKNYWQLQVIFLNYSKYIAFF